MFDSFGKPVNSRIKQFLLNLDVLKTPEAAFPFTGMQFFAPFEKVFYTQAVLQVTV